MARYFMVVLFICIPVTYAFDLGDLFSAIGDILSQVSAATSDACATNPCENAGTCAADDASYTCACAAFYTGEHCETVLDYASVGVYDGFEYFLSRLDMTYPTYDSQNCDEYSKATIHSADSMRAITEQMTALNVLPANGAWVGLEWFDGIVWEWLDCRREVYGSSLWHADAVSGLECAYLRNDGYLMTTSCGSSSGDNNVLCHRRIDNTVCDWSETIGLGGQDLCTLYMHTPTDYTISQTTCSNFGMQLVEFQTLAEYTHYSTSCIEFRLSDGCNDVAVKYFIGLVDEVWLSDGASAPWTRWGNSAGSGSATIADGCSSGSSNQWQLTPDTEGNNIATTIICQTQYDAIDASSGHLAAVGTNMAFNLNDGDDASCALTGTSHIVPWFALSYTSDVTVQRVAIMTIGNTYYSVKIGMSSAAVADGAAIDTLGPITPCATSLLLDGFVTTIDCDAPVTGTVLLVYIEEQVDFKLCEIYAYGTGSGGGTPSPDPCSNTPCQNCGTCTTVDDTYYCTCTAFYTGENCVTALEYVSVGTYDGFEYYLSFSDMSLSGYDCGDYQRASVRSTATMRALIDQMTTLDILHADGAWVGLWHEDVKWEWQDCRKETDDSSLWHSGATLDLDCAYLHNDGYLMPADCDSSSEYKRALCYTRIDQYVCDWSENRGGKDLCTMYMEPAVDYATSLSTCSYLGMELIEFQSSTEHSQHRHTCTNYYLSQEVCQETGIQYFIGLERASIEEAGYWISDNIVASWTNWVNAGGSGLGTTADLCADSVWEKTSNEVNNSIASVIMCQTSYDEIDANQAYSISVSSGSLAEITDGLVTTCVHTGNTHAKPWFALSYTGDVIVQRVAVRTEGSYDMKIVVTSQPVTDGHVIDDDLDSAQFTLCATSVTRSDGLTTIHCDSSVTGSTVLFYIEEQAMFKICKIYVYGVGPTTSDPCDSSSCQNSGTCTSDDETYTCACPTDYTGVHCETMIDLCDTIPCQNSGTCTSDDETYTCACASDYTGVHCETMIDLCDNSPCQNSGTKYRCFGYLVFVAWFIAYFRVQHVLE